MALLCPGYLEGKGLLLPLGLALGKEPVAHSLYAVGVVEGHHVLHAGVGHPLGEHRAEVEDDIVAVAPLGRQSARPGWSGLNEIVCWPGLGT